MSSVLGNGNCESFISAQNNIYECFHVILVIDFYVWTRIAGTFEWKEKVLGLPGSDDLHEFFFL